MNKTYNITWLVKKSPDWIVAELIHEEDGKFTEVSINRTNKKGEPFPGFEELMPGRDVEGLIWQSTAGKYYLFAPRPEGAPNARGGAGGAFKQAQIEKTMDKKNESISKFQGAKEESIKLMAAQRDAVLIVTHLKSGTFGNDTQIREAIITWRNWFLLDKEFNNPPPF